MSIHQQDDEDVDSSGYVENIVKIPINEENIFLEASEQFTLTPYIQALSEKAITYLRIGYAVHLAGPAGTGKTTIALHIADQLGRPVILMHGDDEFGSSDLVGRGSGYHRSKLVDNFIHSVLKTEEEMTTLWMDNRLTTACERGYTLIYDEFNRSRAEANNALLSVLSEGILNLPGRRQQNGIGYLAVHPKFRAIFTSNSEEYVGIHKTQNALTDRLITINVNYPDQESEIEIVRKKSGLSRKDVEIIVNIARVLRQTRGNVPSIRGCVAVARVLAHLNRHAEIDDPVFQSACYDIFGVDPDCISQLVPSVRQSSQFSGVTVSPPESHSDPSIVGKLKSRIKKVKNNIKISKKNKRSSKKFSEEKI